MHNNFYFSTNKFNFSFLFLSFFLVLGDKISKSVIHLPVSRSISIQMMDSFAQTDIAAAETKLITSLGDKDMVDSGVDAQARQSDRLSINEDDEGAVSLSYEDRYRCVSEEDEAVIVDNRSSQEVSFEASYA